MDFLSHPSSTLTLSHCLTDIHNLILTHRGKQTHVILGSLSPPFSLSTSIYLSPHQHTHAKSLQNSTYHTRFCSFLILYIRSNIHLLTHIGVPFPWSSNRSNCKSNLVIVLHELPPMFCHFVKTKELTTWVSSI